MTETIDLDDERDRWRWTCPRRHQSWEPTNGHFWCHSCSRTDGLCGRFASLRNDETGLEYEREQVRLLTAGGPMDASLDRRGSA